MHRATLRVSSPYADALIGSLSPEVGREIPRSSASVERDGGDIVLRLEAEDLPSLRAALNSYLRWIGITEEVSKLAGD